MVKIRIPEFPGLYERGSEAGRLRTTNVALNVIADHEDLLGWHT